MPELEWIRVLENMGSPRVAVLGDFMLDRYIWGDAHRVSPEAPVPVVFSQREEDRPGGAGNVVANLAKLGAKVECYGLLGKDIAAHELESRLKDLGAETSGLLQHPNRPTSKKVRIMARSQQMLRVDQEDVAWIEEVWQERILACLAESTWDVLVLSDYGKGLLSRELVRNVLRLAAERKAPSLVDPKRKDFRHYSGATLVTPNRAEAEAAIGSALTTYSELAQQGEALRQKCDLTGLLITLGAEGMYLLREDAEPLHVPTAARQVYDVTGAGDTVISAMALALGAGVPWDIAVRLANAAAGLAVAQVGTAVVSREDILHHLQDGLPESKILQTGQRPGLEAVLTTLRSQGKRIVFTNGCFDILHAGHVRYLREAKRMGDVLIIGVNDNESVRRLKGPDRPINDLADRMEVLAALQHVDWVVSFAEDTPEDLIRSMNPDVLVKGSDWRDKGVVGAEYVRSQGGEVRFVELLPGRSTTAITERIREPSPSQE